MDEDELRILDELMDEIHLQARVNGQYGETFKSTSGIPQGDSLSPLLFIIYLEAALRDFRAFIDDTSMEECVYVETRYADDADFLSQTEHTLDFILVNAPYMLAKWHLKVNGDKTEQYKLERGVTCTTKKLGSYLDQAKDIRHRTGMANAAFHRMWRLWFRDKLVSQAVRLRMYKAYILPLLTYNIGALGVCPTDMKKLNTTHRHYLRLICRIHYPTIISNERLYRTCNSEPISTFALKQRWRLFGHVRRLPKRSSAQTAIRTYYDLARLFAQYPGKIKTALPSLLENDLAYIG
jgi:hypothetical protein